MKFRENQNGMNCTDWITCVILQYYKKFVCFYNDYIFRITTKNERRPNVLDKIIEQCNNRASRSCTLTDTLAEEYLKYIDDIMTLKQVEKDLVKRKAINFEVTFKIIHEIMTKTEELKNIEEFKKLKENICKAHKYWGYLKGVPKSSTSKQHVSMDCVKTE